MKITKINRSRIRSELKKFKVFKFENNKIMKQTKVINPNNKEVMILQNIKFIIKTEFCILEFYYYNIELMIIKSDFNNENIIFRIFFKEGQSVELYLDLFNLN